MYYQKQMSTFWALVFSAMYAGYVLVAAGKNTLNYLLTHIILPLYYHQNKLNKISNHLSTLQKKPTHLTLSVSLNHKNTHKQHLMYLIQIIKTIHPLHLTLFFHGDQTVVQDFQAFFQELTLKNDDVSIVNQQRFYSQMPLPTPIHTSLILTMTDCRNLNNLPYFYLINAEIGFCPPLSQCTPSDVVNCFEQYSFSKQRNGK